MNTSTRAKRKKSGQETASFSFSSGVRRYSNKNELVGGNITFAIVAVEFDPGGGFTGQDRWKATITRDDNGVTEIITLDANEKRNAQLRDAKDHIAANGAIPAARLVKRGNAFYFRTAEPRCTS